MDKITRELVIIKQFIIKVIPKAVISLFKKGLSHKIHSSLLHRIGDKHMGVHPLGPPPITRMGVPSTQFWRWLNEVSVMRERRHSIQSMGLMEITNTALGYLSSINPERSKHRACMTTTPSKLLQNRGNQDIPEMGPPAIIHL